MPPNRVRTSFILSEEAIEMLERAAGEGSRFYPRDIVEMAVEDYFGVDVR